MKQTKNEETDTKLVYSPMKITLIHRHFIKEYINCSALELNNGRIRFSDWRGIKISSNLKYIIEQ